MKRWLLTTGLLFVLIVGSTACNQAGNQTNSQQVQVTRGDLTLTINGSGTVEASHDAKLTFGIAGRIDKLLVKEGAEVKQGDVIAKLETDALELALVQARVAYAQAQTVLAQQDLAVSQAGVAVTQADVNLKGAQIALEQTTRTSTVSDLQVAQAEVDTAKRNLDDSLIKLSAYLPGSVGFSEFQKNVVLAQARLKAAQDRLDAMLSGFGTDEVILKKQQVTAAEQALATAKQSLELAKLTADLGKQTLEAAALARDNAQKQLDKATLTAPFSGVIATLPVEEGDSVLPSTLIARLIEPDKMELTVQVDEVDIPVVKTGQKAIVKVDALPETDFIGLVSDISTIPKKESGVVLFDVKISLNVADGTGLRNGMSANADIVIAEQKSVLLVPSRIIRQDAQGKNIVEVSVDGKVEERFITTGLTDGLETEITGGLTEGEVLLEKRQ